MNIRLEAIYFSISFSFGNKYRDVLTIVMINYLIITPVTFVSVS